jgi:AcrR family transcriptional regulator
MVAVAADLRGESPGRRAVDGRAAIRDRNRDAVLDAVLDLFSEDNLSPGPDEVALRAGLSVRSVYRYFDDHDALSRAAIERQLERVGPLLLLPAIGEGALDDRIARFVEARLRLQAAAGPALRATRIRATFDPVVHDQFEADRTRLREQIERQFAPELSAMPAARARARLAAADALSSFESIDRYLVHLGLDTGEAGVQLADALHALLTD